MERLFTFVYQWHGLSFSNSSQCESSCFQQFHPGFPALACALQTMGNYRGTAGIKMLCPTGHLR